MTDSPTLRDLIERLEKATEPSRELADEVLLACGWKTNLLTRHPAIWESPDGEQSPRRPNPLESLDAAISLIPEGWRVVNLSTGADGTWWDCNLRSDLTIAHGDNSSAATAVTIAALCARLAEKEARDDG